MRSLGHGVSCWSFDGTHVYRRGQTETTLPYHAQNHPRLASCVPALSCWHSCWSSGVLHLTLLRAAMQAHLHSCAHRLAGRQADSCWQRCSICETSASSTCLAKDTHNKAVHACRDHTAAIRELEGQRAQAVADAQQAKATHTAAKANVNEATKASC